MQKQLFENSSTPTTTIHQLDDAWIKEINQVFTDFEGQQYHDLLMDTLPWKQATLQIAGRQVLVPRLQCWMGDAQSNYAYSGLKLNPVPWTEPVLTIREQVQHIAKLEFNSVLINWYRDGNDSVAWHSDNEPELGLDPIVAAVSFGAVRLFEIKEKVKINPRKFKMLLQNGSLVIMGHGLQKYWQHQVPKQRQVLQSRISLTFRQIC